MSSLSKAEKDLILDFYFRCGTQEDIDRGRDLIASHPEAAHLYADLESTLTDLDSLKYEPCPDNLAQLTVARLMQAAAEQRSRAAETLEVGAASNVSISDLLQAEQAKPAGGSEAEKRRTLWQNFIHVASIAAMFLLISGLSIPVFSNMRMKYRQTACNSRLGVVGAGVAAYGEDHDGELPAVDLKAGSPWFKVGYQGEQNLSNTRHPWLLVRGGYVKPEDFICPGQSGAEAVAGDSRTLGEMQDFPSRRNISYSYILLCDKNRPNRVSGRLIIMADRNPIFESLPSEAGTLQNDEFEKIWINDHLRQLKSFNHRRRGQNVLRLDGSVEFATERMIDGDDIFTIQNQDVYIGREVPCVNEVFLVP